MANLWEWWSAEQIARATGAPLNAVQANWPLIVDALAARGIYDRDVALGVLGTIAIETASTFQPLHEYGTPADWAGYDGGSNYAGRGFIQLTHRSNYRAAGEALGLDLVGNPDLAMDPKDAADILAWYWATRGVPAKDGSHFYSLSELSRDHDWEWVRRAVQGGTAGLGRLTTIVSALDASTPQEAPVVKFDATYPATIQDDDWSCAPSSLDWALRALGRSPGHSYIENLLLVDGVVTREQGLLDASGGQLAAWIGKKVPADVYYGADGFYGNNEPVVTFDGAALEGDHAYPILIGGRNWGGPGLGHWTGVRGYDAGRDVLLLANPAGTSATYGGQEMTRGQFDARGPFSMVRVLHPDIDGSTVVAPPVPEPPPLPTPPPKLSADEIRAGMRAILDMTDAQHAALNIRAMLSELYDRSA